MAGSGKTTFMQCLNAHLHERQQPGYITNLDPAVSWQRDSWQHSRECVEWKLGNGLLPPQPSCMPVRRCHAQTACKEGF